MKNLLLLAAALFGVRAAHATVKVSQDGNLTQYEFFVDSVELEKVPIENVTFERAVLRGVEGYEGVESKQGSPELPAIRLYVRGEGEIRVEWNPTPETLKAPEWLMPWLEQVPMQPGARRLLTPTNPFTNVFPDLRFDVSEAGSERGARLRVVSLYPLEHVPKEKIFQFYRRFVVTHRMLGSLPRWNDRESLLFVVGESFRDSKALAQLREFKESMGYDTELLVVPASSRNPTLIRNRIGAWLAKQPGERNSVIIVGDHEDVPGYESPLVSGATDHFYRSVDTADYESDMGAPDLSLGRLSVSTEAALQAIVTKTIRYVRGEFKDTRWLSRSSVIASDDKNWVKTAEGTLDWLIETFTKRLGYLGSFPTANIEGGDRLYAIRHAAETKNVMEKLNEGRGFVTYGGHGDTDQWMGPKVTNGDLKTLKHAEATPYVQSMACNTGHFVDDSFAEAWMREPHGAIAVWASTDLDYWDDGEVLQRMAYRATFSKPAATFGDIALQTARNFWLRTRGEGRAKYYWETYLTFGDPTVSFRRKAPVAATVEIQGSNFVITDSKRNPIDNARVAILSSNGQRHIRYTNAAGEIPYTGTLYATTTVRVVVTGGDVTYVEKGYTIP